jgi:drug/metabolite transporter (DMT)-like permease
MLNVLICVAAQMMHPFEVAFFRCFFGLVLLLPWIVRSGAALLRSRNSGFYLLRAGVGLVSMASWFYGITVVPLATATAVSFTAPLFATLAAALILHEDVRLAVGARSRSGLWVCSSSCGRAASGSMRSCCSYCFRRRLGR